MIIIIVGMKIVKAQNKTLNPRVVHNKTFIQLCQEANQNALHKRTKYLDKEHRGLMTKLKKGTENFMHEKFQHFTWVLL